MAVRAVGTVSQRRWKYEEKFYERLEVVYLTELAVQVGDELVNIEIPAKGDGNRKKEPVPAKAKAKKGEAGGLEPEDIPF